MIDFFQYLFFLFSRENERVFFILYWWISSQTHLYFSSIQRFFNQVLLKPLKALCSFQLEHGAQIHHSKEHLLKNGLYDKPMPKNKGKIKRMEKLISDRNICPRWERVGSGHLCTGLHCESCTIRVPAQRPPEWFCICCSKYICYFWESNFIVYISGKEFTMFLSCTLKHFVDGVWLLEFDDISKG